MADATYLDRTDGAALLEVPESRVLDFVALLKPRVMTLVVFSGAVGLFVAPGTLHPVLAVVAIMCIGVGSGAAGAVNMWFERDIDALMTRTASRPLPAGRVAPSDALGFAVVLALLSVVLMSLTTNLVAGGLLAMAILFYVFVYTIWLKRRTPQNIVIGGAAGAFPPVIGWAAVTGDVTLVSIAFFAIIFLWTPPHFWALSLYCSGDYARAGVPMMPLVAGRISTKRQMLIYTMLLLPVSLVPYFLGAAGLLYAVGAGVLGLAFIASAVRVMREPDAVDDQATRAMFKFSLLYLFLVFAFLLADTLLGLGG